MRKKLFALWVVLSTLSTNGSNKKTDAEDNPWARHPLWPTVPNEYAAFVGVYPKNWDEDDPHSMTIANEVTCSRRLTDKNQTTITQPCGWAVVWLNGRPVTFYTAGADDTIRRALLPPFVPEILRGGKPREYSMLTAGDTARLIVPDKIWRVYILYCEKIVLEQIEDQPDVVCRTDFEINEPYRTDPRDSHPVLRISRQYLRQHSQWAAD